MAPTPGVTRGGPPVKRAADVHTGKLGGTGGIGTPVERAVDNLCLSHVLSGHSRSHHLTFSRTVTRRQLES